MPLAVRVSMTGTMVPSDSSCAITGSRLEIASSSPRFMIATAPAVAPTPTNAAASGLRPALASRMLTNMLVDEPGAVTPIFMPLRSAGPLYAAALSLLMPSTMPAYLPCSTSASMFCPFACCVIVCS